MAALDELPEMNIEEVSKHSDAKSLWCIIDGVVYDLTSFAAEHPGGETVLLEHAGNDATEPFNDAGHSSDAKEMAKEYAIGRVKTTSPKTTSIPSTKTSSVSSLADIILSPAWTNIIIPTAAGIIVYVLCKGAQKML